MNKHNSPNPQLIQFMLRAQQLARQDVQTDKGYAMMMTSIVTILLFSLMGAFLTMTNIAKSSTDAYIDGNNTFYAAESGLNQRANELRQRFENYNSPSDGATTAEERNQVDRVPTTMSPCYSKEVISTTNPKTTNDFECRNYPFKYSNRFASTVDKYGATVLSENEDKNPSAIEYKAYTFVKENTTYDNTVNPPAPIPTVIATGGFAGLNAQEYRYTVNATAAKPNPNVIDGKVEESGENKTVLQMDFKSRSIPLFQFGAFYNGDLELNPSPQMDFNGRMHSNGNMYLTAGNNTTLRIDGNITVYRGQGTAADPINQINIGNLPLPNRYSAGGVVQIQKTPGAGFTSPTAIATIANLPTNGSPISTAVPITDFTPYNGRIQQVANRLTPPQPGFLGKLDANNRTGEYYGKADLRLEMFPDRQVPFTLQVIASNTGTPGGCATVDFAGNVLEKRADYSKLKCTNLNEGQLRSLMQPVLVRPRSEAEYRRFCPNSVTTPAIPPTISTTDLAVKERILDALYFTLVAQIGAVPYSSTTNAATGKMSALTSASDQFQEMLNRIQATATGQLSNSDITTLIDSTPAQIAALSSTTTSANATPGSCFMAAPIQALLGATPGTTFFDGREVRNIKMLQTNIESLTVWNRDGLFVPVGLFNGDVTVTTPAPPIDSVALANQFVSEGAGKPNSTANNLLFTKITTPVTTRIDNICDANGLNCAFQNTPLPTASFRRLGLAAQDLTEGGLVIHATIDKNTYTYPALQSPYGFAFNGGANLPAPLTIATDQAVYSQGDWNISIANQPASLVADKQPASFLADTIAVLSNNCLAPVGQPNAGKLNCGIQTGTAIGVAPRPATTTTINAAFLGRTQSSTTDPEFYGGGLNNYMRILEDWNIGGAGMTYSGSFISLGAPLEVSGAYRPCATANRQSNYACPPTRNWQYDTSFNAFVGLPPLPPKVIELQQDSFRRRP
jgi:Tfp pilus assembly protein PilX